ncbi:MAG: cell envelope protein SmpA [Alphaproteobacteria bacterium]|nr:cell envelope protein SmpA [Alphaproteobacteria bacterium]|tara:strand:+ start:2786 stop:3223 length:438 start_codon:yes stop_codon:yes gene_type:complete
MKLFIRHGRVLVLIAALSACAPTINIRGQQPDPEALAAIEPGETSRRQVEQALGSPSTEGVFRENVWYYMSERTETFAFLAPELLERKIVAIVFDDGGVVEDIFTYTENDRREVELVSRVTPTAGNELSLIQQLFGNVGRFSDAQ